MFLAVRRHLAFLHIVPRWLGARKIRATPAVHVHHAVLSMLLAVRRLLAVLHVEARFCHAGFL